jgi:ABC-type protease/lipase transport system fused ATPase/permease subunit
MGSSTVGKSCHYDSTRGTGQRAERRSFAVISALSLANRERQKWREHETQAVSYTFSVFRRFVFS